MGRFFILLFFLILACEKETAKQQISEAVKGEGETGTVETTKPPPVTVIPSPVLPAGETFEEQFIRLVNTHRKSIGLSALIHHAELALIAGLHSTNMANKTVDFGHTGFSARCSEGRTVLGGANLCAE